MPKLFNFQIYENSGKNNCTLHHTDIIALEEHYPTDALVVVQQNILRYQ